MYSDAIDKIMLQVKRGPFAGIREELSLLFPLLYSWQGAPLCVIHSSVFILSLCLLEVKIKSAHCLNKCMRKGSLIKDIQFYGTHFMSFSSLLIASTSTMKTYSH